MQFYDTYWGFSFPFKNQEKFFAKKVKSTENFMQFYDAYCGFFFHLRKKKIKNTQNVMQFYDAYCGFFFPFKKRKKKLCHKKVKKSQKSQKYTKLYAILSGALWIFYQFLRRKILLKKIDKGLYIYDVIMQG